MVGLVVAALVWAVPAGAVIPTGNLLADQNPGAELGRAASDEFGVFTPPGWTTSVASTRATTVRYGAPAFPTVAQSTAIGGGSNFFAGGPTGPGDNPTAKLDLPRIALPASVIGDVDAGSVQATTSACLGGYADQDDYPRVDVIYRNAGGSQLTQSQINGPFSPERGAETKLLPTASAPLPLPAGTRTFSTTLSFYRRSGEGTYNDAYADNISVRLSPAGGPNPAPTAPQPEASVVAAAVAAPAAIRLRPAARTPPPASPAPRSASRSRASSRWSSSVARDATAPAGAPCR